MNRGCPRWFACLNISSNFCFRFNNNTCFSFSAFHIARNAMICWNFFMTERVFGIINADVVTDPGLCDFLVWGICTHSSLYNDCLSKALEMDVEKSLVL